MKATCRIICLVVAPWLLAAQPNPQSHLSVHKYSADNLSISFPAEWVEIPKAELDQMSENVRKAAPNARPQPYNYGFQASAKSQYPRVLVQLKTSGRWSEKAIADMPRISSTTGETQARVSALSPSFAALNLQIGKLTYDPGRHLVWMTFQMTDGDGESIQGLSGLHPTNVGSIQVHCYSLKAEFDRYAPLFSEIITSVQIGDDLKYRARGSLMQSLGDAFDLKSMAVDGAVGGIVAVVVAGFLRRRKTAASKAQPPSS